jgi:hypothetical protein
MLLAIKKNMKSKKIIAQSAFNFTVLGQNYYSAVFDSRLQIALIDAAKQLWTADKPEAIQRQLG